MTCKRLSSAVVPLCFWLAACSSDSQSAEEPTPFGTSSSIGGAGGSNGGASASPSAGNSSAHPGTPTTSVGITIPTGAGGSVASSDTSCGITTHDQKSKRAEIIIVLDRSGSMRSAPAGGVKTKWEMLVPSVKNVVGTTDQGVNWGLKFYPEGSNEVTCQADSVVPKIHVPVAENNASKVIAAIEAEGPNGHGTPTAQAIGFAAAHLRDRSTVSDSQKFILLATDGEPNCPSDKVALDLTVNAIKDALKDGYPTFVIGVDTTSASAIDHLNLMAQAGGRPREAATTSTPSFYLASTEAELESALSSITSVAASCVFDLSGPPPVPDNIAVDFNGVRTERDPEKKNGWEYTKADFTQLEVYGDFCKRIQTESSSQVQIRFGCPNQAIPMVL